MGSVVFSGPAVTANICECSATYTKAIKKPRATSQSEQESQLNRVQN